MMSKKKEVWGGGSEGQEMRRRHAERKKQKPHVSDILLEQRRERAERPVKKLKIGTLQEDDQEKVASIFKKIQNGLEEMQASDLFRKPIGSLRQELTNSHEDYRDEKIDIKTLEERWDASFCAHQATIKSVLDSSPTPDHAIIQRLKSIWGSMTIGFEALLV